MFFRFWSPLAFIPFLACCLMEVRLLWEVWLSMSAWAEMILDPWSRVHFVGIFLPFCCSVLKSEFGLFCYFYYIYFRPVIKFIILFWSVFFFSTSIEPSFEHFKKILEAQALFWPWFLFNVSFFKSLRSTGNPFKLYSFRRIASNLEKYCWNWLDFNRPWSPFLTVS